MLNDIINADIQYLSTSHLCAALCCHIHETKRRRSCGLLQEHQIFLRIGNESTTLVWLHVRIPPWVKKRGPKKNADCRKTRPPCINGTQLHQYMGDWIVPSTQRSCYIACFLGRWHQPCGYHYKFSDETAAWSGVSEWPSTTKCETSEVAWLSTLSDQYCRPADWRVLPVD